MKIISFFLLLAITSIPAKADLVIDTFLDGAQTVVANSSNGNVTDSATNLNPNEVLEGRRRLTIQGAMTVGSIRADVDTTAGTLTYESFNPAFSNSFGGRLLLTHLDGDRFSTFDISSNFGDSYVVEFERAYWGGSGPQLAELSLSSPSGSASSQFLIPESAAPFSVAIPMLGLAAADFSNAYNLSLDIGGLNPNAAFQISRVGFVSSVPEPSSLSLIASVFTGFFFHRRRRSRV